MLDVRVTAIFYAVEQKLVHQSLCEEKKHKDTLPSNSSEYSAMCVAKLPRLRKETFRPVLRGHMIVCTPLQLFGSLYSKNTDNYYIRKELSRFWMHNFPHGVGGRGDCITVSVTRTRRRCTLSKMQIAE